MRQLLCHVRDKNHKMQRNIKIIARFSAEEGTVANCTHCVTQLENQRKQSKNERAKNNKVLLAFSKEQKRVSLKCELDPGQFLWINYLQNFDTSIKI